MCVLVVQAHVGVGMRHTDALALVGEAALSVNPELTDVARLDTQHALGSHLCLLRLKLQVGTHTQWVLL